MKDLNFVLSSIDFRLNIWGRGHYWRLLIEGRHDWLRQIAQEYQPEAAAAMCITLPDTLHRVIPEPGAVYVFSQYWHLLNGGWGVYEGSPEQVGDTRKFITRNWLMPLWVMEAGKTQRPETHESPWCKFPSQVAGRRPTSSLKEGREPVFP